MTESTETTPPTGDAEAASAANAKPKPAEAIKHEASKLGVQAADKARGFAEEGKQKASGALNEFARMMDDAASTVDEKVGQQYGQYARSAASAVAGLAGTIERKDVDELVDDVRDFVRKSPAVAIGAAAAIGFVLARVIKSGIDGVADAAETADESGTKG
ncbi:hypothetical protein ACNI3Q_01690 [Sphingomonas sp. FW199]|uniref:hypothetical protein n=1 Tax=Sphingomonas sp. FW199 TaxID=3400217 RepID=UPI003CFB633D